MQAFAPYMDHDHMRGLFQSHVAGLFGTSVTVTNCVVLDSRYKTYRKATSRSKSTLFVCYRITLTDLDSSAVSSDTASHEDNAILYAKIYLDGRSRVEWEQLEHAQVCEPHIGQTPIHLPALDMIVWHFPYDPSILNLPEVMKPELVCHHLPFDLLPPEINEPADLASLTVQMVKYSPEKCCTTRYCLQPKCTEMPTPQSLTLYGKTYCDDRGSEIYDRIHHFWGAPRRGTEAFKIAQPLGYSGAIKTIWQLGIEGLPLSTVIDRSNYKHYLGQVAQALAVVHGSGLGSSITVTLDERLTECIKKVGKLCHACPPCTEQLVSLVPRIQDRLEQSVLSMSGGKLIYGDFHVEQMLVRDSDVYFFDFDSFASGDPEQDLAEFVVALLFYEFEPEFVRLMALALLDSYRSSVRWEVRIERVYWHALTEYVDRAYRFYLQQKPGWADALKRSVTNIPTLSTVIPGLPGAFAG